MNTTTESYQLKEQTTPRKSRFKEGSMSDEPSTPPPDIFTGATTTPIVTTQPSGLYKFGQKLASTFKPVAYWNRLFIDTKQELMEAERKQRQKDEAERTYWLMKAQGQIPSTRIGSIDLKTVEKRDSGVSLTTMDVGDKYDEAKQKRFHLKRPSTNTLREIGRVRADNQHLSVERDDHPALRSTSSTASLKKQHTLQRRVSNLEIKLQAARQELEKSLIEASPQAIGVKPASSTTTKRLTSWELRKAKKLKRSAIEDALREDDFAARRARVNKAMAEHLKQLSASPEPSESQSPSTGNKKRKSGDFHESTDAADLIANDLSNQRKRLKKDESPPEVVEQDDEGCAEMPVESVAEVAHDPYNQAIERISVRNSLDSTRSLEPLYEEEEEETTTIPLKHSPLKPTAIATPARFTHFNEGYEWPEDVF